MGKLQSEMKGRWYQLCKKMRIARITRSKLNCISYSESSLVATGGARRHKTPSIWFKSQLYFVRLYHATV